MQASELVLVLLWLAYVSQLSLMKLFNQQFAFTEKIRVVSAAAKAKAVCLFVHLPSHVVNHERCKDC